MEGSAIDARRMLAELDFPVAIGERRELLDAFGDALEPLLQLLVDARVANANANANTGSGAQTFAIFHLLARALSDLLAGGHLVSHCYLTQAYGVMRPVLDSCDLIELFVQDPAQATLWVNTDEAHKHFAPAKVRRLIGSPKYDPVHGHFSEAGSHPRFRGAQLSGGMQIDPKDPTDQTALFNVGPMWAEHPSALHAWLFAFATVGHLGGKFHYLVDITDQGTTRVGWANAYLESLDASIGGMKLALAELGENTSEGLIAEYSAMRSSLLTWIEEVSSAG
jgi:hypothetical protein